LKLTISNGKSTNVRSKINLCTKSLIIRKKNFSVGMCKSIKSHICLSSYLQCFLTSILCLGSFVPSEISQHCVQKFPRVTKELNGLKNRATGAAKNMKKANSGDDDIETVNDIGTILHRDDYCIGIEEAIKTDLRSFFLDTLISRRNEWVIHRL
jgi:hypothetical protein